MGWKCEIISHLGLKAARTFRVSSRFPEYLIFYQPERDRIVILRVLNGQQDLASLFERSGSLDPD